MQDLLYDIALRIRDGDSVSREVKPSGDTYILRRKVFGREATSSVVICEADHEGLTPEESAQVVAGTLTKSMDHFTALN